MSQKRTSIGGIANVRFPPLADLPRARFRKAVVGVARRRPSSRGQIVYGHAERGLRGHNVTLADFATISTAASGLALTASLIYLALQTHQNAKHTRALIHQGRITGLREVFLASADTDVATAIIATTGGSPTPVEVQRYQFQVICGARIYGWQDTYLQCQNGLLGEDFLSQMRAAAAFVMRDEAAREAWEIYRVPGTSFTAFMDAIAAQAASTPWAGSAAAPGLSRA